MARKDFELIAAALRVARDQQGDEHSRGAVEDTARELATRLAYTNARFDRAHFLAACGVAVQS